MTARSSTLRPYVLPRLSLVDLASRSGLRGEDARKLRHFLQGEPSTSTSNVEGGTVFPGEGSMQQLQRRSPDPEDPGPDPDGGERDEG